MPATYVLPYATLVYQVGPLDSSVVISSTASSVNGVGTVSSVTTVDQIKKGDGLWMDQELMSILSITSDSAGVRCQVKRGLGGSASQAHSSSVPVTLGSLDKFYKVDPTGRPKRAVLVSPWINTINGKVWFPQGDAGPENAVRWWQDVTHTYGIGSLGVRSDTPNPQWGT